MNGTNIYPLTSSQREIWFEQTLHENSSMYNIGGYVRIAGAIDPQRFERAINLLIRRHDSLRTVLIPGHGNDDVAMQRFLPDMPVRVPLHDFTRVADPHATAMAWMQARFDEPFSLYGKPLTRHDLVKVDPNVFYWLAQFHHIVIDGWSIALLGRSMAEIYTALDKGLAPDLTAHSYVDFIEDDRSYVEGKLFARQRQYWLEKYQDLPDLLLKPRYREEGGDPVAHSACRSLKLRRSLYDRLIALAGSHHSTVFQVILAALYVYFVRHGRREELVLGLPVLNRSNAAFKETAGLFVGVSAVRFDFGTDLSFAELLSRIARVLKQDYRHQRFPVSELNRELVMQQTGRQQIFDVRVSYERHDHSMMFGTAPGRAIALLNSDQPTPLTIFVREFHDGEDVDVDFVYSRAYFKGEEIDAIQRRLLRVLDDVSRDAGAHVERIRLVTSEDIVQLEQWNALQREYSRESCLHELFEAQVGRTPEATAVVCEGRSLSYGELNAQANRLAGYLKDLGVRAEVRVGICAQRGIEVVVAILATLKAGGAYVPLDPAYPDERLIYMLQDSGALVLLHAQLAAEVPVRLQEAAGPGLAMVDLCADGARWASRPDENPSLQDSGVGPRSLGYVIYTSGSTGTPKGVMVEHANVVRLFSATQEWFQFNRADVWTLFHSFAFDFSVWEMWGALLHGGRLVVVPSRISRSPQEFYDLVCTQGVTVLNQTPSAFRQLISAQGQSEQAYRLRYVIFGGEALEVGMLEGWYARGANGGAQLINMYGITETTVHVTYKPLAVEDTRRLGASPIGRRIPDLRIYLLDEHREPVPLGAVGEMYIGGAGVARGYLNRPELTAERFVKDPFSGEPDGRLYRTGDLGRYLEDGNLEYLGRSDQQVKIRGFRIELGEIEGCLQKQPGIREAVVLAREDQPGDQRLVAYVVSEGDPLDVGQLREQLSRRLPEYMVPAGYVQLERMPLTANGKLDRRALPAPEGAAFGRQEYEEPQGELESALAQIWSELLGVERVGRQDHFFELGGHSLLAVQLTARVRQRLGLEVSLQGLFAHPVLKQFAGVLGRAGHSELPPLQREERPEQLPLSFAQQRLWLITQMDVAASAAYHIPAALRLRGRLDQPALQRALNRIVERHEVLRTRFELLEGEPVQRIAPAGMGFPLQRHDLRAEADGEQQTRYWCEQEASAAFDLQEGPLIRGRLLRLAEQEHVLLVTMHHIVSDGWSLGVLMRELSALYRAFSQGEDDPLPELAIQYADYALWQRRWLDETLQQQLLYWKQELQGAPALISLPTDRTRPAVQDYAGDRVGIELDEQLSAGLRALSRRHGTTLPMTLLAGWAALAARLSGQAEVVIGTPVANRTRSEVEGLIGFFVNTLALRVKVSGGARVGELLGQVRRRSVQGQSHQDVPFEQVVEALRPVRTLAHSPVFQLLFAWHNAAGGELDLGPLSIEGVEDSGYRRAKYDLTLNLQESGDRIVGELEYASALYERSTMQRHVRYLQRLLAGMVADDQQPMERLPLLDEEERHRLLIQWNATRREYPQDSCIHELFESQVERTPEAVAVMCGRQFLTYASLNERANQLAWYLRDQGIGPERLVGLCVERSLDMLVGLLGILKAGAAYVPLEPGYPSGRLAYMIQDAAPQAVLTTERLAMRLRSSPCPLIALDADWQAMHRKSTSNLSSSTRSSNPHHLAYVIYTSGSTGQPKGVMVQHRSLSNYLAHAVETYLPGLAGSVVSSPLCFDATLTTLLPPLLVGKPVRLLPDDEHILSGLAERLFASGEGWLFKITPAHLEALSYLERAVESSGALHCIVVGGEQLTSANLRRWKGELLPQASFVNEYGPTETVVGCSVWMLETPAQLEKLAGSAAAPIGRPIGNTQLYVLAPSLQVQPTGCVGELYIGGVGVARGYLNQPPLTQERFIANPFGEGRLYKTGDLVRYRGDGELEFVGRTDHQVKIRGFRIELGEIEACLQRQPGVREAVVLAPDEPGEKRLVAYVMGESGQVDVGHLREQLSRSLPEYMLPAAYVQLGKLPLTENGKLDRQALPAPEAAAFAQREYEEPQGMREKALAQIWSDLLGVERIGRQDHFFELGGHSLFIVQMISRLRKFGLQTDVHTVYDTPILYMMASRLCPLNPLVSKHLAAIRAKGSRRPLFFMHEPSGEVLAYERLSRHLHADQPVYGLQAIPDDATTPITNEALAERYVRVIRSVQPHGPYRLAGWSAGGLIAYEMARQLLSDNAPVEFLGMIDSETGTTPVLQQTPDEALIWEIMLGFLRQSRPDLNEAEVSGLKSLGSIAAAVEQGKQLGWFTANMTAGEVSWRATRAWYFMTASVTYRAQPLPIPVHLFRADVLESEDPARGWASIAGEGLRIELIGGTHLSIMEEPYIGKLAASIERVLAQMD